MNFLELKDYIKKKMRMSHIYQPVMIKELLSSSSPVSARQIARRFLEYDASQIEYYEQITKRMPGSVLIRNGIIQKEGNRYSLRSAYESLTKEQREELTTLCEERISEHIQRRGDRIWQHRRLSERAIPGSIRYEVLKRAGFRCELCGTSAEERALEVDHIIPINLGGPDTIENFQALCYKCNSNKRDTDSTDFRDWKKLYTWNEANCLFCKPESSRILAVTELVYVMGDGFPVTSKHVLVVPKRHVASFFELFAPEVKSCFILLNEFRQKIESQDSSVKGFNIGINENEAAGQTIKHCHWHLIPRRFGDVSNPRGGIRNVIPGKGDYIL